MSFGEKAKEESMLGGVSSEQLKKVTDLFAKRIEEQVTDPTWEGSPEYLLEMPAAIREGKKIPQYTGRHVDLVGAFARVCQDFRLTPDETDELKKHFFIE